MSEYDQLIYGDCAELARSAYLAAEVCDYAAKCMFVDLVDSGNAVRRYIAISIMPDVISGDFGDSEEVQAAVGRLEAATTDTELYGFFQMASEAALPYPPRPARSSKPKHTKTHHRHGSLSKDFTT